MLATSKKVIKLFCNLKLYQTKIPPNLVIFSWRAVVDHGRFHIVSCAICNFFPPQIRDISSGKCQSVGCFSFPFFFFTALEIGVHCCHSQTFSHSSSFSMNLIWPGNGHRFLMALRCQIDSFLTWIFKKWLKLQKFKNNLISRNICLKKMKR